MPSGDNKVMQAVARFMCLRMAGGHVGTCGPPGVLGCLWVGLGVVLFAAIAVVRAVLSLRLRRA